MPRPKRQEVSNLMNTAISAAKEETTDDINNMPLNSLEDHLRYNALARQRNKKLGIRRYPIKPAPEEMHPKEKIVFNTTNGTTHEEPIKLSNEMIDFEKKLKPGQSYTLPVCVVEHIQSLGYPIWEKYKKPDGSEDTRIAGSKPRFSVRSMR